MEKIETFEVKSVRTVHHFSCDECGKKIGICEEDRTGYYENQAYHLPEVIFCDWYINRKDYCEDCCEKKMQEIINLLESIGYEAEE